MQTLTPLSRRNLILFAVFGVLCFKKSNDHSLIPTVGPGTSEKRDSPTQSEVRPPCCPRLVLVPSSTPTADCVLSPCRPLVPLVFLSSSSCRRRRSPLARVSSSVLVALLPQSCPRPPRVRLCHSPRPPLVLLSSRRPPCKPLLVLLLSSSTLPSLRNSNLPISALAWLLSLPSSPGLLCSSSSLVIISSCSRPVVFPSPFSRSQLGFVLVLPSPRLHIFFSSPLALIPSYTSCLVFSPCSHLIFFSPSGPSSRSPSLARIAIHQNRSKAVRFLSV